MYICSSNRSRNKGLNKSSHRPLLLSSLSSPSSSSKSVGCRTELKENLESFSGCSSNLIRIILISFDRFVFSQKAISVFANLGSEIDQVLEFLHQKDQKRSVCVF